SKDENWYAIDAADAAEAPLYGVTYTYEGNEYDLRVQKTEEFQDISGMYFDWEHHEGENDPPDVAIDRVCEIQWNETGEGVCLWPEEGLSLSISMTEGATLDRLAEMFNLVQPNIRIGE
nr:hypothetical protein [Clostridia bacterium]